MTPPNTPFTLLDRWETALKFCIGENDSADPGQLPEAAAFPAALPCADPTASSELGFVLATAWLKLYRPWPDAVVSIDPAGGWLPNIVGWLARLPPAYREDVTGACLAGVDMVLQMAMEAPERLPVVATRLDAIDNTQLRMMALDAVSGRAVPDLLEPVTK